MRYHLAAFAALRAPAALAHDGPLVSDACARAPAKRARAPKGHPCCPSSPSTTR